IFTDRAIYRPGQTIYYKAMALSGTRNNFKLLPKKELKLIFYDGNNQKIAEQKMVSNDYGTVSGAFVAPQGGLTGQMRIADEFGDISFSVEEYKRPKFEVLFDTLKGSYTLNDEVIVKGTAKAFAGNNIDGAKVKYRVSRGVNYPQWFYWYRPSFLQGSEAEITNGEISTNEAGQFEIKFKALPDPTVNKSDNADFSFTIYADVTDINGETRSSSVVTRLGYKMLLLDMICPEVINRKETGSLNIVATNLNGVEENAMGEIIVYKLNQPAKTFRSRLWPQPDLHLHTRAEYYKLFPHDLYEDENNQYKWEKTDKVFSRNFDTKISKNLPLDELKKLEPGVYCLEGICKDKNGEEVKSIKYITLYDPALPKLPVNTGLWQVALKTTAEPGEKASFILASSYKDVEAYYDLEWEGEKQQSEIQPSINPIEIAVEEKQRGGLAANVSFVKFGRFYSAKQYITVPFSNKELEIEFSTFRNKLLPGQNEEWKLTLKNKKGDKVAAELLAAMYDASLDVFRENNWTYYLNSTFHSRVNYQHSLEGISHAELELYHHTDYYNAEVISYDQLNLYQLGANTGYGWGGGGLRGNVTYAMDFISAGSGSEADSQPIPGRSKFKESKMTKSNLNQSMKEVEEIVKFTPPVIKDDAVEESPDTGKTENSSGLNTVTARKNFNETAFFFPQLSTNEKGEVVIKFTIPETLTRWKLMTLAHTKDLAFGFATKECVTQKELMVVPNTPRFLREGDALIFSGKISNLSDKDLSGLAELRFYDAITEKEISASLFDKEQVTKDFSCKKGTSTLLEWKLKVPMALQAAKYKVVAKAGTFSDGEEMVLPVLSNRLMVTESMPLPIRGKENKQFTFTKFIERNNNSSTLQDHAFTLEFTSNPAWYAVQSLPYLMEYPYECAEQTFSRYYSNSLATHIANSKPKIKQVFEAWKNQSPQTFLSNLEKNQELKALVIQETPWLLEAKNESENKKRMGLLFDLNRMSNELNAALNKLEKMQTANGGWPWFKDCPEDWYITQHIVCGLAHLNKLGVNLNENEKKIRKMTLKAIGFCDSKLTESYNELKRTNKNYLNTNTTGSTEIQYLYMRSFFPKETIPEESKEAFDYYKKQAQLYWLQNSRYLQAMIALSLNRYKDGATAKAILKSLQQNSISSEEMGTYWKENAGYFWHEAPIERQALMIEAFAEINVDTKMVDDLKTWLIKNKQTTNWGTTRATTEAIYALLLNGGDWLSTEPDVEIMLGSLKLDPKKDVSLKAEPGTGYFKKRFTGSDIKPDMGTIKVSKKGPGVSWGAAYWQYFEQLDKITPHTTPLQLSKKLFLQKNSASGPVITPIGKDSPLQVGDKVIVRIELRSDRDLEYVHLKDMRASGFEPINVLSSYKYANGLGYYESTGDAASNFFISYLPKGTYVFEYPVYVSHKGNFSNGISSIQCMYAPEFTSHSEGIRVSVGGKF
ncbi:MAG: hypothetical protein IT236_12770, partial [Bacteroidia bacterium]|nr:hypothetical protein [Bacteroidia bacterium]